MVSVGWSLSIASTSCSVEGSRLRCLWLTMPSLSAEAARAAEGVLAAIVPPLRSKTSPSVSPLDAPAAASPPEPSPTEPSCSAWLGQGLGFRFGFGFG